MSIFSHEHRCCESFYIQRTSIHYIFLKFSYYENVKIINECCLSADEYKNKAFQTLLESKHILMYCIWKFITLVILLGPLLQTLQLQVKTEADGE